MTLQTGLYSDKAFEILKRLEYYASNYAYYSIPVDRAPDNEIVIDLGTNYCNDCNFMKTKRAYVASKFREMAKEAMRDEPFDIDSSSEVAFRTIHKLYHPKDVFKAIICKVKDLVFIFSFLAGQKRATRKLDNFKDLIGVPKDPIQTAIAMHRKKKIDDIQEKYSKMLEEARKTYNETVDVLYRELVEKENSLIMQRDELIESLKSVA